MGKYKVIQSDETGWLTVWSPDGRVIISNLATLEQAKAWIKRDQAEKLMPVVTPGTVIYEYEENE